jgi:hypothetical protein
MSDARARQPAPYVPRTHPGTPRRWSDEAILRALRQWAEEMGEPPRRQEWSGERPHHAPTGQRKWMREHPYWPSSSCVADHFGSWGKALRAAGLLKRAHEFEDSVAERIQTACRLRARGHRTCAIAEDLGVSVSTVHNYLSAGTCPQCGGPVASPRAERCIGCTANEATVTRTWTRDAVRSAIREWTEEHGSPPSYHEWTPSRSFPGVWEAESPRWPSAAVVCDAYDDYVNPWNAALVDAGAPVRFRRWSDDAIRAALADFWAHAGKPPRTADLATDDWSGPTANTLRRRYGGTEQAWAILGPVPNWVRTDERGPVRPSAQRETHV